MKNRFFLPENIFNFLLGYLNEKHDNLVRPEIKVIKRLRILILPTSFYSDLVADDIYS